jgi:hypothetical protein
MLTWYSESTSTVVWVTLERVALGTLASTSESSECTGVLRDIVLRFPLEFILEVFQEGVVEILTTQVSVTCGGLNCEDTTADVVAKDSSCESLK